MKKFVYVIILSVVTAVSAYAADTGISPVIIDYFYQEGCPDCLRIKDNILPELEERFESFYVINLYDTALESTTRLLTAYQKRLGIDNNESVSMFVDYKYSFNGYSEIESGLFSQINRSVEARMQEGWVEPVPIESLNSEEVVRAGKKYTIYTMVINGLVDGVNPCVISLLVFFMCLLAGSQVRGRKLVLMGISFCMASFVTYTAMGFGLLQVLRAFWGFVIIRKVIEFAMIAVLAVFAVLSFRDAFKIKKAGSSSGDACNLPIGIIGKIRKMMEHNVSSGNIIIAGLICGAASTAFEALCTGQLYVPTLVIMIGQSDTMARGLSLLLIYNAACIMPLIIAFIFAYFGLESDLISNWSNRHAVAGKVLLGVLFIALGILIALTSK